MAQPVVVKMKFVGSYADHLRSMAANRRMSMAALASEYAMRGMDAERNDVGELAGTERRIVASSLAVRSDLESVQAELDTLVAMLDNFVKLMLVHLPEPGNEKEAVQASALARYERFIQQVASMGFEGDRPLALMKIGTLIQSRIETAEENQ
jgi:predicted DNA-binding ribbon-helix-helix protein